MWLLPMVVLLADVESPIKTDEIVTFFPTLGHLEEKEASWTLPIRGWIYEPEMNSLLRRQLLGLFRRSLGLAEKEAASTIFQQRARAFLVDNERRKRIPIRIGTKTITLPASGSNGHFEGSVRLTVAEADALLNTPESNKNWAPFRALTRAKDERHFRGRVQLLSPTGISVISDIDDTVKISEVRDKKALLANTFLREFRPVSGMAELYRAWGERQATIHYVSASPWQLYEPLADFLEKCEFPSGTLHLKLFRWKDSSFLSLFESPEDYKIQTIKPILEMYPNRRFVLVGDSGEKDPEAYGQLARKHRQQVVGILIRNVTNEGSDHSRYRNAFADVPRKRWQIFQNVGDLGEAVDLLDSFLRQR